MQAVIVDHRRRSFKGYFRPLGRGKLFWLLGFIILYCPSVTVALDHGEIQVLTSLLNAVLDCHS